MILQKTVVLTVTDVTTQNSLHTLCFEKGQYKMGVTKIYVSKVQTKIGFLKKANKNRYF
jgi:hypothetical protein